MPQHARRRRMDDRVVSAAARERPGVHVRIRPRAQILPQRATMPAFRAGAEFGDRPQAVDLAGSDQQVRSRQSPRCHRLAHSGTSGRLERRRQQRHAEGTERRTNYFPPGRFHRD